VSWRIYNQVDALPYFPVDTSDNYQPVTTGTRSRRWATPDGL
jgi:hypothetical protein